MSFCPCCGDVTSSSPNSPETCAACMDACCALHDECQRETEITLLPNDTVSDFEERIALERAYEDERAKYTRPPATYYPNPRPWPVVDFAIFLLVIVTIVAVTVGLVA